VESKGFWWIFESLGEKRDLKFVDLAGSSVMGLLALELRVTVLI